MKTLLARILILLIVCLPCVKAANVSYTMIPSSTGTFTDISATGTRVIAGNLDDSSSGALNIGFTFPFFGTSYTQIHANSNGLATFGIGNIQYSNVNFGTTLLNPDCDAIAVLWDDWRTTSGVYAQTTGAAGQRIFILQWNVLPYNGSGDATFQMQLFESNSDILLIYQDMVTNASGSSAGASGGGGATVGIRKTGAPVNGTFHVWSHNSSIVSSGTKIRFSPLGSNFSNVSANVEPAGTGLVTGIGAYALGTLATVVASPSTSGSPYFFKEWRENGVQVSTTQTYVFNVQGDRSLVAVFDLPSYPVTAVASDVERGSVLGSATVRYGNDITLTASANPGFVFRGWEVGGQIVSSNTVYTFPVTAAKTARAVFKIPVTVSVVAPGTNYDGVAKVATATSTPAGLPLTFQYAGIPLGQAPVNAGTYGVTATAEDANYYGIGFGSLVIAKAAQSIAFASLLGEGQGNEVPLGATASSGLNVAYASSNSGVATIRYEPNGSGVAVIHGPGTTFITAAQPGDQNYLPALPEQRVLAIGELIAANDQYQIPAGSTAPFAFDPTTNDGGNQAVVPVFNPQPGSRPTVVSGPAASYPVIGEDGGQAGDMVFNPSTGTFVFTPRAGYRGIARFSYRLSTLPNAYEQRLSAPVASNGFGGGMAVKGDFAVVGDEVLKKLYTYTRNGQTKVWTYTGNSYSYPGTQPTEAFGRCMALDGDTLLVGSPGFSGTTGSAFVYRRVGNGLTLIQQLVTAGIGLQGTSEYGSAVAIMGERIVVGAPNNFDGTASTGAAFFYRQNAASGQWEFKRKLTLSSFQRQAGERFSESLAIAGDQIVVGAPGRDEQGDSSGRVFCFKDYGGSTVFSQVFPMPPSVETLDRFGSSVAAYGNLLAVGCPGGGEKNGGAVYLYEKVNDEWIFSQLFESEYDDYTSQMGWSVAVTDGLVVAGAYNSRKTATGAGATYLFKQEAQGWERLRLASGLEAVDRQWGSSVAVNDGTLLVGESPGDSSLTNLKVFFIDLNIAFGPRSEVRLQLGSLNVSPQITSTVPATAAGNVRFTHQLAVTDPDDSAFNLNYSLEGAPRGMLVTAYGKIIWYPALGATTSGDVKVVVRDGGENGAIPVTRTFRINLSTPGVFRYAFFPMDEILYNSSLYYETNDAAGLSADGLTVAGNMRTSGERYGGYLWSRRGGLTILPDESLTSNVAQNSFISGISGDGSVVSTFSDGGSSSIDSYLDYQPVMPLLWQRGMGYRRLDHPHPVVDGYFEGVVRGLSRTGDWAVGVLLEGLGDDYGDSAASWAGVYREELLAEGDPSSAGAGVNYRATDVSADGSTVVGERHTFTAAGITQKEAVKWNNGVLEDFASDPSLTGFEEVHAVSSSGYESVGGIGNQAVLWRSGYPYPLPALAGTTGRAVATALSDSAEKIAGYRETSTGSRATFSFSDTATFDLQTEMVANGVVLGDYRLSRATALSSDGTIILGNGLKYGDDCGWMVEMLDSSLFPPLGIEFAEYGGWIGENVAPGAVVGRLQTQGGLAGEHYTYQLVSGEEDNDLFALAGANGDEVVTTGSFDFETRQSYWVKVRSTNSVGATMEAVLGIAVSDGYEAAPITVAVQPLGEGNVTGARTYNHGETATLVASPAQDFIEWIEEGSRVSGSSSYQFPVNRTRNLIARFKAAAVITVSGSERYFDGSPAGINVATVPANLTYQVLYNGSSALPIGPGEFPFTVTIQDAAYRGATSGVFHLKRSQSITFADPGPLTSDGAFVPLLASATSGLAVQFSSSNLAVVAIAGNRLQTVSPGLATITATQVGNEFYAPAPPVLLNVTVIPNSSGFDQLLFAVTPSPANLWQVTGSSKWVQSPGLSPAAGDVLGTGSLAVGASSGLITQITGPFNLQWKWRLLAVGARATLRVNGEVARTVSGDSGNLSNWLTEELSLGEGVWSLEWRFENTGAMAAVAGELADFVVSYGEQTPAQPVVSNVAVRQLPGTHLVEITYDLNDADSMAAYVWIQGSYDSGVKWEVPMTHVRGDVGPDVAKGTERRVIWQADKDFLPELQHPTMRVRVVAHDYPNFRPVGWFPVVANKLALIPYGAFQQGNPGADSAGGEWPNREVHLKPYSIGIEEITNQEVVDVFNWAMSNGHFGGSAGLSLYQGDLHFGNFSIFGQRYSSLQITVNYSTNRLQLVNPDGQSTTAYAQYPCAEISRHGAMLYCHYRSLMEGRQSPYMPSLSVFYWPCDFNVDGFRLPTEAEWEKAARGGSETPFPWGETATHSKANYFSNINTANEEPVVGLHPAYGSYPLLDGTKTAPVSAFTTNAYGLRQVIGNVKEWCWDLATPDYASSSIYDPLGYPSYQNSDTPRFVMRGGAWSEPISTVFARAAVSAQPFATGQPNIHGFRVARSKPSGSAVASTDFSVDTRASILVSPPGKLLDLDGSVGANFGRCLSAKGDRLLVGSRGEARIYELQADQTWLHTASLPVGGNETPRSLSLGESHAAIATSNGVKVFSRQTNGSWALTADLLQPSAANAGMTTTYSEFGSAVALDGSRLAVARIVGLAAADGITTVSEQVEALVFERQANQSWLYQTKTIAARAAPEFRTGGSLALLGDTLALGSYRQVTLFARQPTGSWSETATLVPTGTQSAGFGSSLSLSDNWLAVNSLSGLSIFLHDAAGAWIHHQNLVTAEALPGDAPVGISGQVAFAGGVEKVWVWRIAQSGQWVSTGPLTAFDGSTSVGFGAAVVLAQDWLLVGAPLDYEMGTRSGSVYTLRLAAESIPAQAQLNSAVEAAGLTGSATLPNATPFNDGVENLLKYAFNMNLGGPDMRLLATGGASGLPQIAVDSSGAEPVLKVEFLRRKGSGLIYTPQRSTTLGNFVAMTGTQTVTSIDAQWERVTVQESAPPASTTSSFARVEVRLP